MDEVRDRLSRLVNEFGSDVDKRKTPSLDSSEDVEIKGILSSMKLQIAQCSPVNPNDVITARGVFEFASLYSIKQEDFESFERVFAQLYSLYTYTSHIVSLTINEQIILSIYLLNLLSDNRSGEFNIALERFCSIERQQSSYLAFVVDLERHLMEGNYSKILNIKDNIPSKHFEVFMSRLLNAVQESNAHAMERAYERYPIKAAVARLLLKDMTELLQFMEARNAKFPPQQQILNILQPPTDIGVIPVIGTTISDDTSCGERNKRLWTLKDEYIYFSSPEGLLKKNYFDTQGLLNAFIGYAIEMERIV